MTADDAVGRLLRGRTLLLDFDGPICSIFAGYPAPVVASELLALLGQMDVTVPDALTGERDPLEVLRWTGANRSAAETRKVEEALCAAELRAAESAEPTAYGREVIVATSQSGIPVGIVSNNSAPAILAYLALHRLAQYVPVVVGRAFADPSQMKPNPAPIIRAAERLRTTPEHCVLVGDSLADIEGAHAAGATVVGYANRPDKVSRFKSAGADVVVTTMAAVAGALLSVGGGQVETSG